MEFNASSGAWEHEVNTTIIGAFLLPINAMDNSGNFNNNASITLSSIQPPDTTPPEITILSPQNKTYITSSAKLDFEVADPSRVSWIGYSIDGGENITIANYTILTEMLNGSHRVTLFANDTLDNIGSKSVDFVINATNPRISFYVDNSTVIVGSNLSGYRIVDNPIDRRLHLKVVHDIRNSSGVIVKKEWEINGTLEAHSSNSYRGSLYVRPWAPADTYRLQAISMILIQASCMIM